MSSSGGTNSEDIKKDDSQSGIDGVLMDESRSSKGSCSSEAGEQGCEERKHNDGVVGGTAEGGKRQKTTSTLRTATNTSSGHMPSTRPSQPSSSSSSSDLPLLLRLSEACSKHKSFHTLGENSSSTSSRGVKPNIDKDDNETAAEGTEATAAVPERCRKDLRALRAVLPKVEMEYRAPPPSFSGSAHSSSSLSGGTKTIGGVGSASDASHLCAFYRCVITGAFCPHSLELFDFGKGGIEIFPRVHQLFRYLASKAVIRQTISALSSIEKKAIIFDETKEDVDKKGSDDHSSASTCPSIVSDEVSTTIAHLLNVIPERELQSSIVRDLIALTFDLSVLSKSGVIFGDNGDSQRPAVEVAIFGEATTSGVQVSASSSGSQEGQPPSQAQSQSPGEFTIEVPNATALLSLQTGTLRILHMLLILSHHRRGEEMTAVDAPVDEDGVSIDDTKAVPPDTYFYDTINDGDLTSAVLASVRHVLLSSPLSCAQNEASTRIATIFVTRNKIAACRILFLLLRDWDRCGIPSGALWTELSLLVSRAVLAHFKIIVESRGGGATGSACKGGVDADTYAILLCILLRDVVLFPHMVGEMKENIWNIRSTAIFPLLDCISFMTRNEDVSLKRTTKSCSDAGSDRLCLCVTFSSEEKKLCKMVLRAVHASLFTEASSSQASGGHGRGWEHQMIDSPQRELCIQAGGHCTACGIFPSLLGLLKEGSLTSIIICIVAALLQRDPGRGGDIIIIGACRMAWRTHVRTLERERGSTSNHEGVLERSHARSSSPERAGDAVTGISGDPSRDDPSPPFSGNKRRRLTFSSPTAGTTSSSPKKKTSPQQQLHVEQSPKRRRAGKQQHQDETSSSSQTVSSVSPLSSDQKSNFPMNSVLLSALNDAQSLQETVSKHPAVKSRDTSLDTALGSILDDALRSAHQIIRTADMEGSEGDNYHTRKCAAVLSKMSAPATATIACALRLVLTLSSRGSRPVLQNSYELDVVIGYLYHSLAVISDAVVFRATGPAENRSVGPRRLKRVLNYVVGVGLHAYCVHSLEMNRFFFQRADKDKHGLRASSNQLLTESEALEAISNCAITVWAEDSSLLLKRSKRSASSCDVPSSNADENLDYNLEEQFDQQEWEFCAAVDEGRRFSGDRASPIEHRQQRREQQHQRHCCGLCAKLRSSFGLCQQWRRNREDPDCDRDIGGIGALDNARQLCLCNFLADNGCNMRNALAKETVEDVMTSSFSSYKYAVQSGGQQSFKNECALFLMETLPLESRCVLVSCLHPVTTTAKIEDNEVLAKRKTPASTLSSLCKLLDPCFQSLLAKCAALAALPVLIISLAVKAANMETIRNAVPEEGTYEGGPQNNGCGDQNRDENVLLRDAAASSFLLKLLSDFPLCEYLMLYISPKSPENATNSTLRCSSYSALCDIADIAENASGAGRKQSKNADNNLNSAGSFISARKISFSKDVFSLLMDLTSKAETNDPLFSDVACFSQSSTENSEGTSIQNTLASNVLLSQDYEEDGSFSSRVRLVKWKLISRLCLYCSASKLRQSRAYRCVLQTGKPVPLSVNNESCGIQDEPRPDPQSDGLQARESPQESPSSTIERIPTLLWCFRTPFVDSDRILRDYSGRRLGSVLLSNGCNMLFALFLADEEWKKWNGELSVMCLNYRGLGESGSTGNGREISELVVHRLFHEIDGLLHRYCRVPQSQLSFTVAGLTGVSTAGGKCDPSTLTSAASSTQHHKVQTAISHQISAIYALASICQHADLNMVLGIRLFENAFLRLVRFWISTSTKESEPFLGSSDVSSDALIETASISTVAFGELRRLNEVLGLGPILLGMCKNSFIPALFSEILVPSATVVGDEVTDGCVNKQEKNYRFLMTFLCSFLLPHFNIEKVGESQHCPHHFSLWSFSSFTVFSLLEYVDEVYPTIIPALIIEQDYDALRMSAGFRLYLLGEKKRLEKIEKKEIASHRKAVSLSDQLVGSTRKKKRSSKRKIPGVTISTKHLNEQTKMLCISPNLIVHILPRLLLHPDRAPLVFFLRTVVQSKRNLRELFVANDNLILKSLVWELGEVQSEEEDPEDDSVKDKDVRDRDYHVIQALKKGALIREQTHRTRSQSLSAADGGNSVELKRHRSLEGVDAMDRDACKAAGDEAAKRWISSNFMYLLVNVVQGKWKIRAGTDKVRGLKCLRAILRFLRPSDSPQYIPQIMSTINMAMSGGDCNSQDSRISAHQSRLRLLAVQSLSKFVRILRSHQYKTVGTNLSLIVVALFPVLSSQQEDREVAKGDENDFCANAATAQAVSLLEWLVNGRVGKALAPFFNDIPFLPPSPALDKVRTALKSNGVDFDNLLVLTQSTSQQNQQFSAVSTGRESIASAGSGSAGGNKNDSRAFGSQQMQTALRKRVRVLCKLLSHENASVRTVVLRHLTDLLRGNRALFKRLVESEETASMRFLTVVNDRSYSDNSDSGAMASRKRQCSACGGEVTELVKNLLARSVLETDVNVRIFLATCLGEVGAVDPNRLGELNVSAALSSNGFEASGHHGLWRLTQPPWKSQVARYELQLVTKHLVVALKAAPTSHDQHKIAFTIQELLILLDAVACMGTSEKSEDDEMGQSKRTESETEDASGATASDQRTNSKGEMSQWLATKLGQAGVLEIIEPFWSTRYKQADTAASKSPPFFRRAHSYYNWLSSWCRFMVERSSSNEQSIWRKFFFACRSAIRSHSGISVAEFLLPLLVLDGFCFGDDFDEQVIVQEMTDVLSLAGNSRWPKAEHAAGGNGITNNNEHQKAVNAVFMVMDTLQIWAEREIEERHRVARGSSVSASNRFRSTAGGGLQTSSPSWPSDDSIARIEDLLNSVPLSLCAQAAFDVGMHARSLRFLETEARSKVVDQIFNNVHGDDKYGNIGAITTWGTLQGVDTGLMQRILGCLNDCETMSAVAQAGSQMGFSRNIMDHIREKEAYGDWAGALQGCERALQLCRNENLEVASNKNGTGRSHEQERLRDDIATLERGILKSLLELGQFESILNQIKGMVSNVFSDSTVPTRWTRETRGRSDEQKYSRALPFAAEAAWRLGRWSVLDELVNSSQEEAVSGFHGVDADGLYQISLGRAMLGLNRRSGDMVRGALEEARSAVMISLTSVARESYARTYPYLVRLHSLREIENASEAICSSSLKCFDGETATSPDSLFSELATSDIPHCWDWDGRLELTAPTGSAAILSVRLALSRIANEPELEGSLWLTAGKKARKTGLYNIAENSLAHAEATFMRLKKTEEKMGGVDRLDERLNKVQMQVAKLKHVTGESNAALRILGQDEIHELIDKDDEGVREYITRLKYPHNNDKVAVSGSDAMSEDIFAVKADFFGRRILQTTEWMVEGGLKSGGEVMGRYRLVQRVLPKWEKARFLFAKFLDSLLESRIIALAAQPGQQRSRGVDDDALRTEILYIDKLCQRYLLQAMKEYGEALQLGQKHVYQALPRLLTLWFDFTSIVHDGQETPLEGIANSKPSNAGSDSSYQRQLSEHQDEANTLMAGLIKRIAPHAYYTAMPQLISRVGHRDESTSEIVKSILKRVLTKFPSQSMWPLACLRHSANPERSSVGEEIFDGAQKNLLKKTDTHNLLVASKSLFKFLIELARYQPKDQTSRQFSVRPWKGEVELKDFVPPVQAALSISSTSLSRSSARDVFPSFVPRMRSFNPHVQIMHSKAKPKKLTAFAIPAGQANSPDAPSGKGTSQPHPDDAGEMHFLVKQEERGDLRKDARVQDLNNVINRLLSESRSSGETNGTRQRRRLHLRTFSVVCLSEDCGILEWVPNTDNFRNLVTKAYNPQADPHSMKRRGRRIANFNDQHLRASFQKCQDVFFKNGNLIRASAMFEELCTKHYPPLLYWWFVRNFLDPHAWFEARTNFTLSAAVWSAVGHVIGLGDRHSENILVDTSSGDCVHVDFDCIFDKGLNLPRPEVVPFRLTPNMLDAFGPTGPEGMYSGGLKTAMRTLRENRDTLLSVLEPFLKDPVIDWKRHRAQQKQGRPSSSHRETVEAKRSIKVIDGRLRGIYNLRNPNLRKVRRTDGYSVDQEDETSNILPLSVEGQVHRMISEATSSENLVQLYVGWMPWV